VDIIFNEVGRVFPTEYIYKIIKDVCTKGRRQTKKNTKAETYGRFSSHCGGLWFFYYV
jgi:hypothetical protein